MEYKFLLDLALIIMSAKIFTVIAHALKMPKVLGGLIAGVILGPAVLNFVQPSLTIEFLAKIAIIFIMFLAGMQTDLKKFLQGTKNYILIAILGVVFPLLLGFLFSHFYINDLKINLFLGVVMTATSVSITVETLMEMKKMKTNVGLAILGAGVVDDVLGIVFLTVLMNSSNLTFATVGTLALNLVLFIIIAVVLAFVLFKLIKALQVLTGNSDNLPIFSIGFALLIAYMAEYFGLSCIIGAYIAGIAVGATSGEEYIEKNVNVLVSMFFAPIFFASIGLKLTTLSFSKGVWIFIILFTVVAIISKVIGNGLGARIRGYTVKESFKIGIGMATRGEVALIMVSEAKKLALINEEIFSIVLVSVLLITIITPVLLYFSFAKNDDLKPIAENT